ncbi:JAB domain-containing protein [Campylobacter sp.]|uniref:JAB domain-containing protein n=1 Tax=Campylobacter sp. TaxID=205 RepID=UPI0025C0F73B|nr:JAB domain-containing protein [Campylobacter sp.]
MNKNLHNNHRQRVRARFIRDGSLDSFEEHQVLEMLLFYAVPRKDTNELAHKLINEYGNLFTLMNAKPEDIMKRCKISETTAVLISMIPYLCRKFLSSGLNTDKPIIDNFNMAKSYFEAALAGQCFESFYMICLDLNKKLKKVVKISDGISNSAPIYMEKIVGDALLYNTSFLIVGHNHPSGTMKPSSADLNVTMKIISACKAINITVLDHIIICGEDAFSFAKKGLCGLSYK